MTQMSVPGTGAEYGFTTQGWSYNHLGQMTGYNLSPYSIGYPYPINVSYNYGATGAAGKLESMTRSQNTTSTTVNYAYDSLGRLTGATSTDWGQDFIYDGFGTLYKKIGTGSAASVGTADWTGMLDSAKNQIGPHNAVGNALSWGAAYDVENRLTAYGTESYLYDPSNKRVMRTDSARGNWYQITLWVGSMRIGAYGFDMKEDRYIGGRRIAPQDRLGSYLHTGRTFLPYGEELNPTSNDADKFATYRRDSTGLDYADQRYYSPGVGRFLTADPYMASAGAADPSSWNRYAYVEGDPINYVDPKGLAAAPADSLEEFLGCIDTPIFGPWSWKCSTNSQIPNRDRVRRGPRLTLAERHEQRFNQVVGFMITARLAVASKENWPEECTKLLASAGVTPGDIIAGALRMEFWQGNGSNVKYAELFANTGAAATTQDLFGDLTIGQYIAAGNAQRSLPGFDGAIPRAKAVAELNGTRVFLNPIFISPHPEAALDHQATIIHEALHNITGRTDGSIPSAAELREKCF
jgi:RHS repeat-associated protein